MAGLTLTEAAVFALARGLCVRHGDLLLRPVESGGRLFYIVGDGLMPVTGSWIPRELAGDRAWCVVDDDGEDVADVVRLVATG